jgi:hypothetical protein
MSLEELSSAGGRQSGHLQGGKIGGVGVNSVFRTGAPRPQKIGTTRSPWRHDADAFRTLHPSKVRQRTIAYRYMPVTGENPPFATEGRL